MANIDIWSVVHAERRALADDLAGLSDGQWQTPSLCDEWPVRSVLAHMTAAAKITPGSFFPKLLGAGFKFERLQAKGIEAETGASPADTLARFHAIVSSTKHPPGPPPTMLGETVVHAEDIRRPLGIAHRYPTDALMILADFFRRSNLIIGSKRRIAGVTLRATDTDWCHGAGPEASGPILSLLMAMTGRRAALADLTGEGVAVLQTR